MEGVGARLGRSSTRYGPTTVFTGPVRKWKKKWVHASSSNSSNLHHQTANGNANGSSHLLFYKWTAITPSQNKDNNGGDSNNVNNNISNNGDSKNSDKDDAFAVEEPPKRKFKYIPVLLCKFNFSFCVFMHVRVGCRFVNVDCKQFGNWIGLGILENFVFRELWYWVLEPEIWNFGYWKLDNGLGLFLKYRSSKFQSWKKIIIIWLVQLKSVNLAPRNWKSFDFEKYGCEMKPNFHQGPGIKFKFKGEMVKNLDI